MRDLVGMPMDSAAIEQRVGTAYGTGHYERILYKPIHRGDDIGLLVTPIDKGWGPNFVGFGLQLSDDFNGQSDYQIAAEATFTGLSEHGAEARVRAGIGRVAALSAEWYQPWGERGQFYLRPDLRFDAYNQPIAIGNGRLDFRVRRAIAGARLGWNIGRSWRFEGGLEYAHNRAQLLSAGLLAGSASPDANAANLVLSLDHDNLDDLGFPTEGTRGSIDLSASRPTLGSGGQWRSTACRLVSGVVVRAPSTVARCRGTDRMEEPRTTSMALATIGGFTRLSGYGDRELIGEHSTLGRAIYYRRFGDMSRLFAMPAYVGVSAEAGRVLGYAGCGERRLAALCRLDVCRHRLAPWSDLLRSSARLKVASSRST